MSRRYGVIDATVESVDDPDGEGRILVRFPRLSDDAQGFWAPVATLMAGAGRGSWFRPEVGDEVLVAFLQGDVQHPYVLGGMWNGEHQPPETDGNKRTFKSKSGHLLTFDDTGGGERIEIRSQGGLKVVLDDAEPKIELEGGGRRIVMSEGKIEFF